MRTVKIRELKQDARRLLQGRYSYLVLVTITLNLANVLLNSLLAFAVPVVDSVFTFLLEFGCLIVVNMLYYLLLTGMYRTILNITQNLPFSLRDLTFAFRHHPEPVAAYSVLASVVQYGAFYLIFFLAKTIDRTAVFAALCALLLLIVLWFTLTYFPVLFFHTCNPSKSFRELMHSSRTLMKGHRLKLLRLDLSFIGVFLLGLLSFGIGLLFIVPYQRMTQVLFCLKLFGNPDTEPEFHTEP